MRPTPDGLSTVVVSHETQTGMVAKLGRVVLAPRLKATDQAWLSDLVRAARNNAPSPVLSVAAS